MGKGVLKQVMFYWELSNISISCVVCTHRNMNKIEYALETLVSSILKSNTVSCTIFCFKGFPNSARSLYSFSLNVPLTAGIIESAELY